MRCVESGAFSRLDASVQMSMLLNEVLHGLSLETVFLGQPSYEVT